MFAIHTMYTLSEIRKKKSDILMRKKGRQALHGRNANFQEIHKDTDNG